MAKREKTFRAQRHDAAAFGLGLVAQAIASSNPGSSALIRDLLKVLAFDVRAGQIKFSDNLQATLADAIAELRLAQERHPVRRMSLQDQMDKYSDIQRLAKENSTLSEIFQQIIEDKHALQSVLSDLDIEDFGWTNVPFETHRFTSTVNYIFRRHRELFDFFLREHFIGNRSAIETVEYLERKLDGLLKQINRLNEEIKSGKYGNPDENSFDFIESSFVEIEKKWEYEINLISFLKDRLEQKPDSSHDLSVVERTGRLAAYANEHGDVGLEAYARLLFPEWGFSQNLGNSLPPASIELPAVAPEIYQGLRGPETPPEFVKRVYGDWLGQGLTRANIRALDPALYNAINNWSRKNDWPAEVDLPTLKEQNNRDVARLGESHGVEILGKFTGREAARLGAAIARRTK